MAEPKTKKKLLSVYIDADLIEQLNTEAVKECRTKSGQVEYYLSQHLTPKGEE
jgi:hypothetical protein